MKVRGWHVVVALMLLCGGYALAHYIGAEREADLLYDLEQAEAEVKKLTTAKDATSKQLASALDANSTLSDLVQDLNVALGEKPKVVTVTKWRTREIEVPYEKVVLVDPVPCPEQPELICYEEAPPAPKFVVDGAEAWLEARSGVNYVVGTVGLTRTFPEPAESLAEGVPWEFEATEVLASKDKIGPKRRGLSWALRVQARSTQEFIPLDQGLGEIRDGFVWDVGVTVCPWRSKLLRRLCPSGQVDKNGDYALGAELRFGP